MQQLSLFAPEEEPIPPGYERVPEIGETCTWTTYWEDGDTSPASLERLALLCVRPDLSQEICRVTNGDLIFLRNIEAHVQGDRVVVTSRRLKTPKNFRKRYDLDAEEQALYNGSLELHVLRKMKQQL